MEPLKLFHSINQNTQNLLSDLRQVLQILKGALVWQRHLITSTHLVLKTLLFMNRNYWSMLQKNFLQFTICGLLAQQKKKQV